MEIWDSWTDSVEKEMEDRYGREIDYMRISITDHCNLKCHYCMPDEIAFLSGQEMLTDEEIVCICRAAVKTGIRKFKITGGEPLVRLGCAELIGEIKRLPGVEQVTLTTNGVLLEEWLPLLLENGLDAVNVSLDTLCEDVYEKVTTKRELPAVLKGIHAAVEAGIPVKINCVLQKDVNDSEWESLIHLAKEQPVDVRFIEMMPIGYGKRCQSVSNIEVLERLRCCYPQMTLDTRIHGNGPAIYYRIPGYQGSIGFISAIHGKFCCHCNRIRLTARGELKPCLCYGDGIDLRKILQSSANVEQKLQDAMHRAVWQKPEAHCFETPEEITEFRKMIQIGG
jgi:molybdenum cofactor biosynthesis protein A